MNHFTYIPLPQENRLILKRFVVSEHIGGQSYFAEIVYLRKYREHYGQMDDLDKIIFDAIRSRYPNVTSNVEEINSLNEIQYYKEKWLPKKDIFETPIRICPKITVDEMQALGGKGVSVFEFNVHTYIHKSNDDTYRNLYKYLGFLIYYPYTEEAERKLNMLICDPNSEKIQFLENI